MLLPTLCYNLSHVPATFQVPATHHASSHQCDCWSCCWFQVSTITIQTEVLHVIRQLLVTWLPRSQLIRDLLMQLPHVNPQMLTSFQEQLLALNSEKDQRSLIKQLLAESAGEQARAVLNAVSKVPVTNVPEPKQKVLGQGVPAHEEIRFDWSEAGIAM